MRAAIRKNPVRVQLSAVPSITIREPATRQAAAAKNAADEGSPGTTIRSSSISSTGDTRTTRPSRVTGTRARRSMRSVWSRLGIGSVTDVSPSAKSAATRTHDLTWALATGSS